VRGEGVSAGRVWAHFCAASDHRQAVLRALASNGDNNYVGSVIGKAWEDAVANTRENGADNYIARKNVDARGVVPMTRTSDKSFSVGLRIFSRPQPGWLLYNPAALPAKDQPADGSPTNVRGAIDPSWLPLSTGTFANAQVGGISSFVPSGALLDDVVLVNSNAANAHAWGNLGITAEARPQSWIEKGFMVRAEADIGPIRRRRWRGPDSVLCVRMVLGVTPRAGTAGSR